MGKTSSRRRPVKLAEVVVVLVILAVIMFALMPTLGTARKISLKNLLEGQSDYAFGPAPGAPPLATVVPGEPSQPKRALAHVKTFQADIEITPKLSVGTARPEKIYEAAVTAEIAAMNPAAAKQECEIQMPLPPEIISLSDLEITVNSEPSENVSVRDGVLIWYGQLDATKATPIEVTYTAVGRGIYTLHTPPGKIVDLFKATLTANESDLQIMALSLQPVSIKHEPGKTIYEWDYKRLMYGRPIALDVLSVAPRDQLAGVIWLGPGSVVVFGVLVSLLAIAYAPEKLDKWMLLLLVGTFAAAYPLMYFAQDFASVRMAVGCAAGAMLLIIAVRSVTLFGFKLGVIGSLALAVATMGVTLWAALVPARLGLLLTAGAIGVFVVAMILLPKAQKSLADARPAPPVAPEPPQPAQQEPPQ